MPPRNTAVIYTRCTPELKARAEYLVAEQDLPSLNWLVKSLLVAYVNDNRPQ